MNFVRNFIQIFNDYFPYERYRFKTPISISSVHDKMYMTEINIPKQKVNKYIPYNNDAIRIIVNDSFCFSLTDFCDSIQQDIAAAVVEDFGQYEFQSLYCEYEDEEDYVALNNRLKEVQEENSKFPSKWL